MNTSLFRPSHWRHLLARLFGQALPSALGFSAGQIGDAGTTTVEVHFTGNVNATDYKAGCTIKVNSVSQTINTAARQADHSLVLYALAAAADADDLVTFQYDDASGDYQDDYGAQMGDIPASITTNYVGSHLYWDTADDAVWIGATA